MKLLIIENADQDRFGIDTVVMAVPADYEKDEALESSGLERPTIVDEIEIDEVEFSPLINLGEYRGFIG